MTANSSPTEVHPARKIGVEFNNEDTKLKTMFCPDKKLAELYLTRRVLDSLIIGTALNIEP